ncbi:hypothetical protein [Flavobacterium sp. RSSB_23]|uniref:hypothetical protein n=1 Tax=Flavobacterium sp. RSSB_23 TaxID=3447668 RepID=UPI003F3E2C3C
MKNILKIVFFIVFTQTSFAQKINKNLISKKLDLNLSLEPKMRGIESDNVIYYIEKDMQTLSAYTNGKLKWKTNIISVCGKPNIGKSEIRVIKLRVNKLSVVYGKHSFAEVDINTGKTQNIGSD